MVSITELLRMPTGKYCVLLSDYRIVEEATKRNEEIDKKLEQALKETQETHETLKKQLEEALAEAQMWMDRATDNLVTIKGVEQALKDRELWKQRAVAAETTLEQQHTPWPEADVDL